MSDSWATLMAALAGGLLTALGAYIVQRAKLADERRRLLLAKLEQLYKLSSRLDEWADQRVGLAALIGLGSGSAEPALAAMKSGAPRVDRPTEELVMLARYYHQEIADYALDLERRANLVEQHSKEFETYIGSKPANAQADPDRLNAATIERDELHAATDRFKQAAADRAANLL